MATFSKFLSAQFPYDVAQIILDGFNCYYRIFREANLEARYSSKSHNWLRIQELLTNNIFLLGDTYARKYCLKHRTDLFTYPQHLRCINQQMTLSNERISE
jgi:isocitrate dehydrogenase kinase/phosphatase